jgi:hypothetical protein
MPDSEPRKCDAEVAKDDDHQIVRSRPVGSLLATLESLGPLDEEIGSLLDPPPQTVEL